MASRVHNTPVCLHRSNAHIKRVWKETSARLACMQVDQPLCYDCIHRVQDEVEVSIREAQQECAAYEAALARLREDDTQPYTDEVCSASILHLPSCSTPGLVWKLCVLPVCCISQSSLSHNCGTGSSQR